jgi:hypothetical protein
MKLLKSAVLTLSLTTMSCFAEVPTESSIKVLLDKSGSSEMGLQAMNQMIPALKQMAPELSEGFWDEFQKQIDISELENMIIPIYQKHLTQEDIDATIQFYDTKAGRNFMSKMPIIMQESMTAGQQWGQGIAQKVMQKQQQEQQK